MTLVRTNMVPNPGAEVDLTGWTAASGTLTRDTTVSCTGAASFKLTSSVGMNAPTGTAGIPVTAGKQYIFSCYAIGTTNSMTIQADWYTADGTFISSASPTFTALNTSTWTRVVVATASSGGGSLAPATAAYVRIRPRLNASSTCWIDDVLVEEANLSHGTFGHFDGDTPDTGRATYAWTGTPGLSTSTATYARTNLVPNPSAELTNNLWSNASRNDATGSWAGAGVAGGWHLIWAGANTAAKTINIPVTAGLDYTASAYLTKVTVNSRSGAVTLHFFDSAGAELDAPTATLTALTTQSVPQRYSMTRTAPAGAVNAQVWVRFDTNGNTGFDAVMLEQSSTLGDYFDGSWAPPGYATSWLGTAHSSPSVAGTPDAAAVRLKLREGTAWNPKYAVPRHYSGGTWQAGNPKRWNGSAWVEL